MKSIIKVLPVLFLIAEPAFSQADFKVIKVNGIIMLKARGIPLETGTVFSEKEDLVFRSEDATAAVINQQRGRLVLTSRSHDLSSARSNYLPSMYNISSRGAAALNNLNLAGHFSGRYVVLEEQKIRIDEDSFPMDNDHFFFLRYLFKGEEINKKLGFSGDTLIIDKSTLFSVDGKPIPSPDNTSIRLFYRRAGESVFISEFDLIFPDMMQLQKETEIILGEMKNRPVNEKVGEVFSYINELYGKVTRENLAGWLESRFSIK